MKVEYPKWMYHADEEAMLVSSAEEQKAKCPAPDWHEFPVEQSEESDGSESGVEAAAPKRQRRKRTAA